MATPDQMLRALHKADPKTLSQRYTPQQLQAAYAKLKAPSPAPIPVAPASTVPTGLPTNPTTGAPEVPFNVGSSESIQAVGGSQEGLNLKGAGIANQNLSNPVVANPFTFQADDAARQRIEDQAFARLTRGVDDKERQGKQELMQNLADRGIPYSNDPNSRYQMEMNDFNNRFDTIRGNARQDATAMGGQELQRQYDIQSGAYNTALSGTDALSKIGLSGSVAFEQLSDADKARALQKWLANKQMGGRGGGASASDNGFGLTDPGGSSYGGL